MPIGSESVSRLLAKLDGVRPAGHQWMALCPAHEDRRASLTVRTGPDGRALVYCHAGCTIDAIIDRLGLEYGDLFDTPRSKGYEPERAYDYLDRNRNLLFQVTRFFPKDFRQRTPKLEGGWHPGLNGSPRVLYRLPEVLDAASQGRVIFVVEGEKDADALVEMGFIATTCSGGAGKWIEDYIPSLAGAHLVILPDNDDIGKAHACQIAQYQYPTAKSVRIIELPGLPLKGDVSDWLEGGGTASLLKDLVRTTPRYGLERRRAATGLLGPKEAYALARIEAEKRANLIRAGGGLRFPWPQVDAMVGRMVGGQLVVLGGRAKQGKSTLLRECFVRWTEQESKRVMYVGTEQPAEEVRALNACHYLGLTPEAINQPEFQDVILEDIFTRQERYQEQALIYVPDKMDIDSLAELTHLAAEEKCEAVIFDHFTRLDLANKQAKWSEAGDAIKHIKRIARRERMLIVTGAQLTDGEGPFGQFDVPGGSSWAYTRELQRECDIACVIWRPLRRAPTPIEVSAARTDPGIVADLLEANVMAFRIVAHRLGGERALTGGCRLRVENGRISG